MNKEQDNLTATYAHLYTGTSPVGVGGNFEDVGFDPVREVGV